MHKNYKELNAREKAYNFCLDDMKKEKLQELLEELGDVERMLKAMIKSLENKHLNPWILDSLNPFSLKDIEPVGYF